MRGLGLFFALKEAYVCVDREGGKSEGYRFSKSVFPLLFVFFFPFLAHAGCSPE